MQSTGSNTVDAPLYFIIALARTYADLGQFDDAQRYIDKALTAVETTQERWFEAEVNRIAGEITLMGPQNDSAKAEAFFEHALAVARKQQAKSWELRAVGYLSQQKRTWID